LFPHLDVRRPLAQPAPPPETKPPSQPRQVTLAVRSWWLWISVKAESVEENKESGIILDLTGRRHRLNNHAAILQSKIT
jgi:hypothetical protein